MKKLLILAALLTGCGFAEAQKGFATTALPPAAEIGADTTVYRQFTLYRYSADGIAYKVYYNNRRRWLHTVLSYDESHLPASVRDRISSVYCNYRIYWVDEIRAPGESPLFRVELEGCRRLLVVLVNEEDIEQEAEYEQ